MYNRLQQTNWINTLRIHRKANCKLKHFPDRTHPIRYFPTVICPTYQFPFSSSPLPEEKIRYNHQNNRDARRIRHLHHRLPLSNFIPAVISLQLPLFSSLISAHDLSTHVYTHTRTCARARKAIGHGENVDRANIVSLS